MMIRKNIINKIKFIVKFIKKIMINNEKCLIRKIIVYYNWQDNHFWTMKQSFLKKNKRNISEI